MAIGYASAERTACRNKTKIFKSEFDWRGKAVIVITGRNRNEIKNYLADLFNPILNMEV